MDVIEFGQGETIDLYMGLYDEDDYPVSIAGHDLEFRLFTIDATDPLTIPSTVTIIDDNRVLVNITDDNSATLDVGQYVFSLVDQTDGKDIWLGRGIIEILGASEIG